jgi:hypothetical protein
VAKVMTILTAVDFDNWKIDFDAGADARRAAGWHSEEVYLNEQINLN